MQAIKALIEKFWAGTATDVEKRQLFDWMNNKDSEWQQLMEEEYYVELNKKLQDSLHQEGPGQPEQVLEKLHQQIAEWERRGQEDGRPDDAGKIVWLPRLTRWAAAAVILIGLGFGIFRYAAMKNRPTIAVQQEMKRTRLLRQEMNRGVGMQHILLQDGSVVDLSPGSEVTYYEPFDTARELTVNGKALFKVVNNPASPFIVYAKGVATRVLGTKFIVNTQDTGRVSVLLLEGKVSVHTLPGSGIAMKDTYLAPGQQLAVDLGSKDWAVGKWKPVDTSLAGGAIKRHVEPRAAEYACVFNKTPLSEVFRQLSRHYKTRILFNTQDLEGQSFTGKILKTDQLEVALSVICNTNELGFRSDNGDIVINKQRQQ
jgi:ferric-dicitrate binding protein FerR (iron transport regulator)